MKTKRLFAALMASTLVLSMAACSNGSEGTESTEAQGDTTAASQDGPYQISMVLKTNSAEFWNARKRTKTSTPILFSWTSRGLRLRPPTRSSSICCKPTLRWSPMTAI